MSIKEEIFNINNYEVWTLRLIMMISNDRNCGNIAEKRRNYQ